MKDSAIPADTPQPSPSSAPAPAPPKSEPAAKGLKHMWSEFAVMVEKMGFRAQSAVALQTAATCEEQLKERLVDVMKVDNEELRKKLFTHYGPWSTFAGKIDTCYALGLIEKYHYDILRVIMKIRNEFAHSHEDITFKSDKIVKLMHGVPSLDKDKLAQDAELLYFVLAAEVETHHSNALGYAPRPTVERP